MPDQRGEPIWHVGVVSVLAVCLVVAYAVLAPVLAPESWHGVDLSVARSAPGWQHWFGTDASGRDLFVRIAQGLRVSLLMATVATLCTAALGLLAGTIAAAWGGWVDAIVMRIADSVNALPHLLLGIVVVAFFPGSVVAIVASIALTHWPQVARLVRSEALGVARAEYVDAARLAGATRWQVASGHLVPAAVGQGLVAVILLVPHAIWHESTLSFLGLGLSPDRASLGTILEIARGEVLIGSWWMLLFPALALVVTSLALAGVGRVLRAHLVPRAAVEVV